MGTTDTELTIATADGPMPTYESRPEGVEARGGIVVIQEAFGVTDHIQGVARWLAAEGWQAIAPALFHRQGSPVLAYDDFEQVMPVMGMLTAEGLTMDMLAALDHLEAAGYPAARTGVVGFCMGGNVALVTGTLRPLGAAVTFYGGGVAQGRFGFPPLIEVAPTLLTPWLGLYGDADQGIPVEEVEALRAAAATATVATEVVRYPDAQHGFNCNDRPQNFHPEASADGRRRTLEWFSRHLG